MERKAFSRVLIDSVLFVVGAVLSAVFGLLANKDVWSIVWLTASAATALLFVGAREFIWSRHAIRCRILTFSQRPLAHALVALLVASVLVILALLVNARFALRIAYLDPFSGVSTVPPAAVVALAVVIFAAFTLVIFAALTLVDRMMVQADHCYSLLRRINRQREDGIFTFEERMPIHEIRRMSRILDYLAAKATEQGDIRVRRRLWAYQLIDEVAAPDEGTTTPEQMRAPSNAATAPVAAATETASAPSDEDAYARHLTEQERHLAKYGTKICQDGAGWRWRRRGGEAQALTVVAYAKELFGNQLDQLFNQG
ncbi:MAG: hypothetical protein IVW57_11380, partial [Ktedonobacterales bacterium]|nr:hypothetical protein [Ktedonobacterales bacterium]